MNVEEIKACYKPITFSPEFLRLGIIALKEWKEEQGRNNKFATDLWIIDAMIYAFKDADLYFKCELVRKKNDCK